MKSCGIRKGETKQFIDYQEYKISDNTLFFISQGQLHSFEAWHGLEGFAIMVTEDFFLLNQQNQASRRPTTGKFVRLFI